MLRRYILVYRNEFITEIEANSKEEAIEKSKNANWKVLNDLHDDLIEFEDFI